MNIRSRELQKINAFSMKRIILFEKIQSELQRAPVRFSSHVPSVYLKQRFPNSVVRVSDADLLANSDREGGLVSARIIRCYRVG